VAATARKKGLSVTVLEAAPRLLSRVLAPMLSNWYTQLHRSHGVNLVLDACIAAIDTNAQGSVSAVRMADGTLYPADLVVVGIGVAANDTLAQAAGLECERGIVVDACGRTSDACIVAAGDCTARRLPDSSLIRLESVQNATEQGKSAAAALLGVEKPFTATPWFWSDQYDKKLQMAGLSMGAHQWAVRGDIGTPEQANLSGSFSVYHFKDGQLLAVDSVNASQDHLQARKLLDAGVSPTPEQAANQAFDLATLLAR
jgi:3-phenylpropionate/trans-cinnamate dioxygenase ferredoxin reductase subunit